MSRWSNRCPRCGAAPCHQKYKPVTICDMNRLDYADGLNPVDGVICQKCHIGFRVRKLETEMDFIVDWQTEYEFTPNFCPNCGERVVSE